MANRTAPFSISIIISLAPSHPPAPNQPTEISQQHFPCAQIFTIYFLPLTKVLLRNNSCHHFARCLICRKKDGGRHSNSGIHSFGLFTTHYHLQLFSPAAAPSLCHNVAPICVSDLPGTVLTTGDDCLIPVAFHAAPCSCTGALEPSQICVQRAHVLGLAVRTKQTS